MNNIYFNSNVFFSGLLQERVKLLLTPLQKKIVLIASVAFGVFVICYLFKRFCLNKYLSTDENKGHTFTHISSKRKDFYKENFDLKDELPEETTEESEEINDDFHSALNSFLNPKHQDVTSHFFSFLNASDRVTLREVSKEIQRGIDRQTIRLCQVQNTDLSFEECGALINRGFQKEIPNLLRAKFVESAIALVPNAKMWEGHDEVADRLRERALFYYSEAAKKEDQQAKNWLEKIKKDDLFSPYQVKLYLALAGVYEKESRLEEVEESIAKAKGMIEDEIANDSLSLQSIRLLSEEESAQRLGFEPGFINNYLLEKIDTIHENRSISWLFKTYEKSFLLPPFYKERKKEVYVKILQNIDCLEGFTSFWDIDVLRGIDIFENLRKFIQKRLIELEPDLANRNIRCYARKSNHDILYIAIDLIEGKHPKFCSKIGRFYSRDLIIEEPGNNVYITTQLTIRRPDFQEFFNLLI